MAIAIRITTTITPTNIIIMSQGSLGVETIIIIEVEITGIIIKMTKTTRAEGVIK